MSQSFTDQGIYSVREGEMTTHACAVSQSFTDQGIYSVRTVDLLITNQLICLNPLLIKVSIRSSYIEGAIEAKLWSQSFTDQGIYSVGSGGGIKGCEVVSILY